MAAEWITSATICPLCDGLDQILEYDDECYRHVEESEAVDAIGDRQPERRIASDGDWQKIRITLDWALR